MRLVLLIRLVLFLFAGSLVHMGCGYFGNKFELRVERVDKLNGFMLNGISLNGKVKKGCIANNDIYVVKRNGSKVLEAQTRILSAEPLSSGRGFANQVKSGQVVSFYVPDGSLADVKQGDIISAKHVNCSRALQ